MFVLEFMHDTFLLDIDENHYLSEASSNEGTGEVQHHEYFRTYRRTLKASIKRTDFGFASVTGSVVRDLDSEPM
jgi:hypothetical protein